jgi:hypothetical protein
LLRPDTYIGNWLTVCFIVRCVAILTGL